MTRTKLFPIALAFCTIMCFTQAAIADGPNAAQIFSPGNGQQFGPGTKSITVDGVVSGQVQAKNYNLVVQIIDPQTKATYSSQGTQTTLDGQFMVDMPQPNGGWPPGKRLQVQVLYQGSLIGFVNIQILNQ